MRNVFLLSLFLLFGIHNIYAQLTVSFSSNPPSSLGTIQTCLGSTITYTSTSTNVPVGATISWDFPGGNPSSANSIGPHTVIYNTAGTYTATLTIDGVSSTVNVNVANGLSSPNLEIENFLTFFGYIQDTLNTGDIVMAYCQTPAQPYNSLIQFDFTLPAYPTNHTIIVNWGDGSSNTYAGNIGAISHTYDCTTTNLYTANVTVISPAGCVASQNYPIYSGVPPQMSVTGNSSNHCNPEPYGFTINSNNIPGTTFEVLFSEPGAVPSTFTGPFPLNFEYVFGDHSCGQTAIISGPGGAPISYPNSFAASLLAENFCGSSFLSIGPIYVGEPPLSLMEVNPDDYACVGENVTIQNISELGITTGTTSELSELDMKELLDFAIECRKRVKLQLQNMDETFEEVDFSYTIKSSGNKVEVETLEVLEHLKPIFEKQVIEPAKKTEETKDTIASSVISLSAGQKIIRDNQTGISYDLLFGAYLYGATDFKVIDPYVRLPYQLRNFMELAKLISQKKDPETEVKLHLVTSNNEDYIEGAKDAFEQMTYSLESIGIIFTYEFDENIHDRSINMDNGWKIVLGRGLDIWQKTGGWYDVNEYIQEKRLCKACEVTFLKG